MKSYSIGHFIDVDGISSQAVLGRSNARRGIETVHIDITYRDPIAALRQATPEQGEIVRFFDFGYGPVLETPEALGEFKRIASQGDLEIYDHHKGWPRESEVYQFARRVVVPRDWDDLSKKCTTQILYWFFGMRDNVSEMLSYIANASDFGDDSVYKSLTDYTKQLEVALRGANNGVTNLSPLDMIQWFKQFPEDVPLQSGNKLFESEELWWHQPFLDSAEEYTVRAIYAKEETKRSAQIVGIQVPIGITVAVIGFADRILYMKDGVEVLKEVHPDFPIYACVYSNGSITFSRGTGEVDMSRFGRAFGGGGRELGSGGFIPNEWMTEPQEEVTKRIKSKLEETLANIS